MATTAQKKTDPASSRKSGTSSTRTPTSRSSAGGSRTNTGSGRGSGGGRGKASEPQKPIRREVGAVVCLLLAFFTALGCFHVDALFINVLCGAAKGLIGYGFWLLPFALLGCAYILGFHKGRPVQLRVWCTMLLPVIFGAFLHLFLAKAEYPWAMEMVKALWTDGKALASGGVVAGLLSQSMVLVFSEIGAIIVLTFAMAGLIMAVLRITPADLIEWFQSRPHPEYEEAEEVEEEDDLRRSAGIERPISSTWPRVPEVKPRRSIDIPYDGEEVQPEPKPAPEEKPQKRGFFNRKATVPAPDQVLTGAPVQEESDSAVEPDPVMASPEPFSEREAHMGQTKLPEITREPAVPKLKKGEAAEASAQVGQEVEEAMKQLVADYQYPSTTLLKAGKDSDAAGVAGELRSNQTRLTDTIHSFGIDASIINVTRGPSVTRYELELDQGVRLNKLTNLADDIALALGASGVRIAPIPDKISMVGIEVPNKLVTPVAIREVIESDQFQDHDSKVAFALGKDIGGNCIVGNIAKLPHLLIAGTTGSGKSVCTNSLIISLLYKATPEEVRLIMVDPKMVELGIYNGIPHLLIPVVTDPKKAAGALQWAVVEMMKRYRTFSEAGVRDLASYNAYAAKTDGAEKMPQIVVVIDELADLMLVAAKEVEESICRVAQMGRAAGMHLIVATQRPSADVITGLMKANIPSRIAFAVASSLESRIILDNTGAEKLVGRGDMLYLPLGAGKPTRVQGCLITDEEVASVVEFVKKSGTAQYDETVLHEIDKHVAEKEKGAKGVGGSAPEDASNEFDELLPSAIEVVVETGMASVSMLQRRLKLGYSRAARLVDQMEEKGVVGPFEGAKPRQVLITKEQWQEMQYKQGMVDLAPDAPPVSEPVPEELEYERDAIPQPEDRPPFDMGEEDF